MPNRVTKAERGALRRDANALLLQTGATDESVIQYLMEARGVSRYRASQAVAWVLRRWRAKLIERRGQR